MGGQHYSVSTGLSDPGSLRVQQGRARLCSPLALGRGSEQTQSGPLSSSGVEKFRETVEGPQDMEMYRDRKNN